MSCSIMTWPRLNFLNPKRASWDSSSQEIDLFAMSGVSNSLAEKTIFLVSLGGLGLCLVQWQNFIIINSVSTTTTNSNPCFKTWPCITKPAHDQLSSTEIGSRRHFLAWIKQPSCPLPSFCIPGCMFVCRWISWCVCSSSDCSHVWYRKVAALQF